MGHSAVFNPRKRFVNFMLFAIVALLLNLLAGNVSGYADLVSNSIYTAGMLLLTVFIFLYKKGYDFGAKVMATFFFNIIFFVFTWYYGLRALIFIYYFPFLISFVYMFKDQATKTEARIFFYTSSAFITCTFLFCSMNGVSDIDPKFVTTMYKKNFIIAFIMASYYFYAIFTYLIHQNQNLQHQKEIAEEASMTKARFLSIMSHELRTPLNGIIGTVNLMDSTSNEADKKKYLDVLNISSRHLLHLVNNVLDYSKASAGKMELFLNPLRVSDVMTNLFHVFQSRFAEKNISLELTVDPSLHRHILADDVRLMQVLTNLLSNALKFTDSGKVTIKAVCLDRDAADPIIQITVSDTGKGLTPEQQAIIFDSFSNISNKSRMIESTGLGLSISKKIIDMMGGNISVQSQPQAGSSFLIEFAAPWADEQMAEATAQEQIIDISPQGMTILVVEDDPINMLIAREFLKRWEVNFLEACNGAEGIAVMQKEEIDIVLLDLNMPVMDGMQVMEWMVKHKPSLPAIAFTAGIFDMEEKQRLFEQGFSEVVPKPFAPEELEQKVKQVLRKNNTSRAA
jgi:signal transduction histidine kinase/CheY-like chemotaxis protein